jgi:hypothetical protein
MGEPVAPPPLRWREWPARTPCPQPDKREPFLNCKHAFPFGSVGPVAGRGRMQAQLRHREK